MAGTNASSFCALLGVLFTMDEIEAGLTKVRTTCKSTLSLYGAMILYRYSDVLVQIRGLIRGRQCCCRHGGYLSIYLLQGYTTDCVHHNQGRPLFLGTEPICTMVSGSAVESVCTYV